MKREWIWKLENTTGALNDPLWAVVERLEALVAIGDELEQVGDVIANHLSFGGQPVGEGTHPANWQCQKIKECSLFNGHQGSCIRPHDHVVGVKGCAAINPATGDACMLLAGHDAIHAFPEPGESDDVPGGYNAVTPPRTCQCVTPMFMGMGDNLCSKCGCPKDLSDAD